MSKTLPLISNLSIIENSTLLLEYHRGMNSKEARMKVVDKLKLMEMETSGEKREPYLNEYERFVGMFIRASILDGLILIDRPFLLLENGRDEFVHSLLERMKPIYDTVRIIDYTWNSYRYGVFNGE